MTMFPCIQVVVTSQKTSKEALTLKALVHQLAPKMIREQVAEYIRSLKEGTHLQDGGCVFMRSSTVLFL